MNSMLDVTKRIKELWLSTCRQSEWLVSTSTSSLREGVTLYVSRLDLRPGSWQNLGECPECNERVFATQEEAMAQALGHDHLLLYVSNLYWDNWRRNNVLRQTKRLRALRDA